MVFFLPIANSFIPRNQQNCSYIMDFLVISSCQQWWMMLAKSLFTPKCENVNWWLNSQVQSARSSEWSFDFEFDYCQVEDNQFDARWHPTPKPPECLKANDKTRATRHCSHRRRFDQHSTTTSAIHTHAINKLLLAFGSFVLKLTGASENKKKAIKTR